MLGHNSFHEKTGKIFRQLERINPSAAPSLEEGLEETLTVHRLGGQHSEARTLAKLPSPLAFDPHARNDAPLNRCGLRAAQNIHRQFAEANMALCDVHGHHIRDQHIDDCLRRSG